MERPQERGPGEEPPAPPHPSWAAWRERLRALCAAIREAVRAELAAAGGPRVTPPTGRGAGDVTFALDQASEARIDRWLAETAREEPLSLLTEDRGWRHLGPDGRGGVRTLPGFDHGGPRIALDPVDGTRNLMADLRSAWTVVSFAPPGEGVPRLGELVGGIVSELPPTRVLGVLTLSAAASGPCTLEERDRAGAVRVSELRVDADDRADHGYFPVFRYEPRLRPAIAALEARFFERLERLEGAETRSVYDDQYISNAGQLVLLARGVYRMVLDPRALVAERAGTRTVCSKPYDLAGAVLCARAAGAVVTAADGGPLDFPLDARTPVHFAGWANEPTRARLEPHWLAALDAVG